MSQEEPFVESKPIGEGDKSDSPFLPEGTDQWMPQLRLWVDMRLSFPYDLPLSIVPALHRGRSLNAEA